MRYEYKGNTIEVKLQGEYGKAGYSVECTYIYDTCAEKYKVSMYLMRDDIDDKFILPAQKIHDQYIECQKKDVSYEICRIIEQGSLSGFFDEYIERYEYYYKCFDAANAMFERINAPSYDKG